MLLSKRDGSCCLRVRPLGRELKVAKRRYWGTEKTTALFVLSGYGVQG